jgi:ribonuclease-3
MARQSLAGLTGYAFSDAALLRQALTHRSFGAPHNERLEFLGDGVLNCVVAAVLYERFSQLPEGELSRLRASLVNQQSLFGAAQQINLGSELLLGEGELKSGGAQRPSILADALEALIGAAFLDGGFDAAYAMVLHLFARQFADADPQNVAKDAKTQLQEYLQSRRIALPQYSVLATGGEAHEQSFRVECAIPELNIRTQGEGTSRRSAEQVAARLAYELSTKPK